MLVHGTAPGCCLMAPLNEDVLEDKDSRIFQGKSLPADGFQDWKPDGVRRTVVGKPPNILFFWASSLEKRIPVPRGDGRRSGHGWLVLLDDHLGHTRVLIGGVY